MVPSLTVEDRGLHVLGWQAGEVELVTTDFPRDPVEFSQALHSVLPKEANCVADPETSSNEIYSEETEKLTLYQLMMGKLIRAGLNSGLCGPVYEETDPITEAFIVNGLPPNSIAEIIFNPQRRRLTTF